MKLTSTTWLAAIPAAVILMVAGFGCGSGGGTNGGSKTAIRVDGSDTMINLAQAWAEEYDKVRPDVAVQVAGGGSGVGIANLISGQTDIANASREMKEKELQLAEANTGKKPKKFVVGKDAVAVYTHKGNPLEEISLDQLAGIYGEGGDVTSWSQLDVRNTACTSDEITRVGRQNNSGTYECFRDEVLGQTRDFKLGSIDQSGSKDVVALVARTPCAIGYSGMGYKTDEVNWLKIAPAKGEPGVAPSADSVQAGTYPLARPLLIYTLGEPEGAVKDYIDWILSDAGQKIVLEMGYVPVNEISATEASAE